MSMHSPDCLGHYDFEHIAHYAKKRFIEGYDTVSLLKQAGSGKRGNRTGFPAGHRGG